LEDFLKLTTFPKLLDFISKNFLIKTISKYENIPDIIRTKKIDPNKNSGILSSLLLKSKNYY